MRRIDASRFLYHRTSALRPRAVVLLLVLVLIAFSGSLAMLITAGSTQLVRTTRTAHQAIVLRQITDSAMEWLKARDAALPATPVTLSADVFLPEGSTGTAEIRRDKSLPGSVLVKATIRVGDREFARTSRFSLPH